MFIGVNVDKLVLHLEKQRFREWAQMTQLCDTRPNDDVIDILGFLTFEIVCSLTEEAMNIKNSEDKLHQIQKEKQNLDNNNKEKPKKENIYLINLMNWLVQLCLIILKKHGEDYKLLILNIKRLDRLVEV